VLKAVKQLIEQLEAAEQLGDLGAVRKVSARGAHDRIRVGDYRLGLVMEDDGVECIRCRHRRDINKRFP
jgi:mRNA interferase RelE/StbE